jgi:hypothetical protein
MSSPIPTITDKGIVACTELLLGCGTIKQLISITVIAHATEEYVTSTVTSHNNRRAAGSGVLYAVCATVEELLGEVFSVGSAPRLYHSTN